MKIKLKDFRCYSKAHYELPDTGLVLLSGVSGSGKSTLLKAILYALFGSKAVRKPYAFGATSCSVTLEFMNIKIQRTNRPNRLVVNDRLEDAVAQAFIDEKLGMCYDEFLVSSYIPQKNNNSVLSLSQAEQLKFIKTLAFEGEDNANHKAKIKEMIEKSTTKLTQARTESEFVRREINRLTDNIDVVESPLHDCSVEEYKERLNSYSSLLEKLLDKKERLSQELQKEKDAKEKLSSINKQLSKLEMKQTELEGYDFEEIGEEEDDVERGIKYLELQRDLKNVQEEYKQIKIENENYRQSKRKELEQDLWPAIQERESIDKQKVYRKQLSTLEQYKSEQKKLDKIQKSLDDYRTLEELKEYYTKMLNDLQQEKEKLVIAAEKLEMEKEIINCPQCDAPLRWKNDSLVSVTDHQPIESRDYKTEIKKLDVKLTKHKKVLKELQNVVIPSGEIHEDADEKLNDITEYINRCRRAEEELVRLKNDDSPVLKRLSLQIKDKSLKLGKFLPEPKEDIKTLREKLRKLQVKISEQERITKELKQIENEKKQLVRKKSKLKEYKVVDKDKLEKVVEKISNAKAQREKDEEIRDTVEKYILYKEQNKELKRWEKKLAVIEKDLQNCQDVHTANLTIKDKYLQAEIIALESTINIINEHTRYYLENFFPDNQLSATLGSSYQGKKVKAIKVNTLIDYKGNEYDNINQLSGGEFDRCTLASVCGINSMLGSSILILDESLASLDADTNTEIIRFLKDLAEDKLILVCSHEAVRGIFDTVLELS